MELTTYSQCACASCGTVLDYRPERAGEVIECHKCGEKSRLPEARELAMVERLGPPIPEFRNCQACTTQLPFFSEGCPVCEKATQKKQSRKRLTVVASVVACGLVTGLLLVFHHPKKVSARTSPGIYMSGASGLILPHSGNMIIEQPKNSDHNANPLRAGRFDLAQNRGSDLMVAVGDIENDSEKVFHDLRADVDLFDRKGAKVGTVSDYISELAPHQSWHFVTQVDNTNASQARLAQVVQGK